MNYIKNIPVKKTLVNFGSAALGSIFGSWLTEEEQESVQIGKVELIEAESIGEIEEKDNINIFHIALSALTTVAILLLIGVLCFVAKKHCGEKKEKRKPLQVVKIDN
jgi:hypothetical protein